MKGPSDLSAHEDCWKTVMGMVFPGERVIVRGMDLFKDLRDIRWMDLFLYAVTGRRFSENQIRLFETIWALGTSYPDPRIWNNRIVSLAGTARSTCSLGIGAAVAVSEARIYGRGVDVRAIDFFFRAKRRRDEGASLQEIVSDELAKFRGIPGYGRPMRNVDERIEPVCAVARELGLGDGVYLKLAFDVEAALLEGRFRIKMNAAALGAALAADMGLSTHEYYRYLIPSFLGGMLPCYAEAAERTEGVFLPISCDRVEYTGPAHRHW